MLRGTLGKPNTKLATFAAKGLQPCVAPWIRGSRNLLGLVCDWPNRSPMRALPAPPTAARHVVGGVGTGGWSVTQCVSRGVLAAFRLVAVDEARGQETSVIRTSCLFTIGKINQRNKIHCRLCAGLWFCFCLFFFSFLIIRVVGSFFLSFVLFCF